MIELRPHASLGGFSNAWLTTKMHVALGDLGAKAHTPVGALRIWNDDDIAAQAGFPLHAHRDVEIVSYIREGSIVHRDDLGSESRIEAGDVQVMSAGTGIRHAEFNGASTRSRVFQIWLDPRTPARAPRWDTARFPRASRDGRLVTLVSGDGDDGALYVDADARLLGAGLHAGQVVTHALPRGRCAYLVTTDGPLTLNGTTMAAGDGAVVRDEAVVTLRAEAPTEVLLLELA